MITLNQRNGSGQARRPADHRQLHSTIPVLGACCALADSELVVAAARAAGRDIAGGGSWPQFAGSVVFILLTEATGIAFGALLHHSAAAIVTYFALGARGPDGPGR